MTEIKTKKAKLQMDIIKAFGADFDLEIKDSLFFVSENTNAIIYPVGHHIAIRNIFSRDQMRKIDILFIYNDPDVLKITSMNISKDYNMLLVCEKKEKSSCISVYNLSKLNFDSVNIFKPKRKVISKFYSEFRYASFSWDGNYICSLGIVNKESGAPTLHGIIWDVQNFLPFKEENYKPKCQFELPFEVNKITLEPEENKILCTSGNMHLTIWHIYENTVKPFKEIKGLNVENHNFLDHDWVKGEKNMICVINDKNEILILEKVLEAKKDELKFNLKIEQIKVSQTLRSIFGSQNNNINATMIKSYSKGLVVGSAQGNLLFVEKVNPTGDIFKPCCSTSKDKPSKVVGISFSASEEYIAVAFKSNEICTASIHNIFENSQLKEQQFEINFDVVCDGFHDGEITSMDVALQRPIIVTSSQKDKTIRIWNYLTGHCEYCKFILTEKENNEKEIDILSVAIHPNGYYLAVSDPEMIRFFHLCYKELRYYNNDSYKNENTKKMCSILKFSNGGHLLAALSYKTLYIIKSYSRETLKEFKTPHTGHIKSVVWDENDGFIYTIGSEGMIVEYNLFSFKMDELSTKFISYSGATMFGLEKRNPTSNFFLSSIISCGQNNNKNIISQVTKQESEKIDFELINTEKKIQSLCQIRSKRFDIFSLACGTDDGMVSLMQYPFLPNNNLFWESIRAHSAGVNFLHFSKDMNMLFSAGKDGNIFVYCIYEKPDGENIVFEENKASSLQLTSIMDEGLGDNVLFPLEKINKYEDEAKQIHLNLKESKKREEELARANDKKLLEKEGELNRLKDKELKIVNDQLKEMKTSKDTLVEHFEEKLKKQLNDHHKLLIEKEKQYNDRIESLMNTIHDLHSRIIILQNDHENELKKKDEEYEKKILHLEQEMRLKFDELKSINKQLNDELEHRAKLEEMKFNHLDEEHEQEIAYKQEKFQSSLVGLQETNHTLVLSINKKEEELKTKNEELKTLQVEKKNLGEIIKEYEEDKKKSLKNFEEKNREFGILQEKLTNYEKILQEEKKISGFSSKLKNELYKRNTEIMGHYNKQHNYINDLKNNSQNVGKELEETLRLFQEKEKEVSKHKNLYSELMKKMYMKDRLLKAKDMVFENLLQKIYETFQENDKNKIIGGLRKIYGEYISDEVVKEIEDKKLNSNIKNELDKQIDFLQNSLKNVVSMKNKKDNIQKHQILITTKQNADLINHLNDIKKQQSHLEKENLKLNSECSAMSKTIENFKKDKKKKKIESNDELNEYKLPELKKEAATSNDFFKIIHLVSAEKRAASSNKMKGKLYKGSVVQSLKKNEENFRLNDIMKVMEEKNEIIFKLNAEIQRLKKDGFSENNLNLSSRKANQSDYENY